MKNLLAIIIVAGTLVSCTDPKQAVVDELRTETIELHDVVMPRMGELVDLGADLKKLREGVVPDSADSTGAARLVYTEQIAALDEAYEVMMEWMADYEPLYDKDHPLDSAVVYYEGERSKITKVKQAIEKSIEDAEKLKKESGI